MKARLKYILQRLLGFQRYLFIFSLFKIKTLKWDKKERDFLFFLSLIPTGGIALDIGANIGIMTIYLARRVINGTVIAFEPIPYNVKILRKVLSYFKITNVEVCEYALGSEERQAEMVMPVINAVKMQGLSHILHDSITENNKGETFKTEIKKIDNINKLKNTGKPVTAIKMDVENFEYFVFEGARELLQRDKPIVYCELWDNENRKKCFELMHELSYDVKVLINGQLVLYKEEIIKIHPTQNFFFIPGQ